MKIEQKVEVDAPMDRVWALVNDVPRIAPCMPGARLTNVVDERTYEGTVQVKLGPINVSYKGTAVLEEVDEATRSARIAANGKDVRGGGTARAGILMKLDAVSAESTSMAVTADVQLTGKVASFGRGAIQDVSAKLFKQFAQCLRETLETESGTGAAAAPASAAADSGSATPADAEIAGATAGQAASGAPLGGAEPTGTAPTRRDVPATGTTAPPARAHEPIRAAELVVTAVVGLLRAWSAALIGLLRRLLGRG